MQIENIIKDLPLPPSQSLSLTGMPTPPTEMLGISSDGSPQFPSQLLQLKWQLFCVQRSQQELASAIFQLSSMILANSTPQMNPPYLSTSSQQQQIPLTPGKRRWNSRDRGSSSQLRFPLMSLGQVKTKIPGVIASCQCDACQKSEIEPILPKPMDPLNQSPLDLYVSYFLNSLENKQVPLPPLPPLASNQPMISRTPVQQQVSYYTNFQTILL